MPQPSSALHLPFRKKALVWGRMKRRASILVFLLVWVSAPLGLAHAQYAYPQTYYPQNYQNQNYQQQNQYQYQYSYQYPGYNNYYGNYGYGYNTYPTPTCTITMTPMPGAYPSSGYNSAYGYGGYPSNQYQYGYMPQYRAYQTMLLSWSSSYASTAYLSPNGISVPTRGTMTVYPQGNQVYTMTVYGSGGTGTCQTATSMPYYTNMPIVPQQHTHSYNSGTGYYNSY